MKIMKKLTIKILTIALAGFLFSCSDSFLDMAPKVLSAEINYLRQRMLRE